MQQVRKLGHLPKESQSNPQEQLLAQQLRKARASGLLGAFQEELQELVMKDQKAAAASTATEHVQSAEALMQEIRALRSASHAQTRKQCTWNIYPIKRYAKRCIGIVAMRMRIQVGRHSGSGSKKSCDDGFQIVVGNAVWLSLQWTQIPMAVNIQPASVQYHRSQDQ